MALVDLTKQLAQQAILQATSTPEKKDSPAPAPGDSSGLTILGELQAMQRVLREDEELVVSFETGAERIRVVELFLRTPQILVLSGQDGNRNLTRVIAPVSTLQLVCKTMKVAAGAKPVRVALVTPKKDSSAK